MKFKLEKITGDASFRQYYRLFAGTKTSIIVESKKEKFKNLIKYSVINKFLRQKGIFTPKLLNEFYSKGIIEIEDFGNISFYKYLKGKNKYNAYKKLISLLHKFQKIKPEKVIYSSKKFRINLEYYGKKNLHKESDLFFDWYLPGVLGKKKAKKYGALLRNELNEIYNKINFKNKYFVHRDFHGANFMIIKNKIGVIDTQDAIIGNPAYDLVSLIDDVRVQIPLSLKKKLFNFYLKKAPKNFIKKKGEFITDFYILSIQRNLKILGIFYRLFKRDKKKLYLKFIPNTWKQIELRLKNDMFKNLKLLLDKAVNKKLRNKKNFK